MRGLVHILPMLFVGLAIWLSLGGSKQIRSEVEVQVYTTNAIRAIVWMLIAFFAEYIGRN